VLVFTCFIFRFNNLYQGEVESIAQMKPKAPSEHEDGLLEYLEDIIGTSKYKEPIEEALLEMDRLQEDRGEKLNRLRIVEREKNALEDQKKEAEDFLRLQNEHVRALSRLWQFYLWKCLINEEEFEKKMVCFYFILFKISFLITCD
jgi:structural maintenance of chromosome 4